MKNGKERDVVPRDEAVSPLSVLDTGAIGIRSQNFSIQRSQLPVLPFR